MANTTMVNDQTLNNFLRRAEELLARTDPTVQVVRQVRLLGFQADYLRDLALASGAMTGEFRVVHRMHRRGLGFNWTTELE